MLTCSSLWVWAAVMSFHWTPAWVGLQSQSLQGKSFQLASLQGPFSELLSRAQGVCGAMAFWVACLHVHVYVCTHTNTDVNPDRVVLQRDRILYRKWILLCGHHFPLNKALQSLIHLRQYHLRWLVKNARHPRLTKSNSLWVGIF